MNHLPIDNLQHAFLTVDRRCTANGFIAKGA